jgi:hypothetical protein
MPNENMSWLALAKAGHIELDSVSCPGHARSGSVEWPFFFGHIQDNDYPSLDLIYGNNSSSMSINYIWYLKL